MEKLDRITTDPARMNGEPCIRNLRLTVRRVLEALAIYPDRAELKREYPLSLTSLFPISRQPLPRRLGEFESLFLRDEARKVFVNALLNPPQPNEALKAAAARHKQVGL
jgi:uncharacterized protein (DUF433 family)